MSIADDEDDDDDEEDEDEDEVAFAFALIANMSGKMFSAMRDLIKVVKLSELISRLLLLLLLLWSPVDIFNDIDPAPAPAPAPAAAPAAGVSISVEILEARSINSFLSFAGSWYPEGAGGSLPWERAINFFFNIIMQYTYVIYIMYVKKIILV